MSQEPNTTNDTNAKPRLIVPGALRKPGAPPEAAPAPGAAPPAGADSAAIAAPRLSFAPKKRSDSPFPPATAAPVPAPASPPPPTAPTAAPRSPPTRDEGGASNKTAWHRPGHEIPVDPTPTVSGTQGLLKRPPPGTRLVPTGEAAAAPAKLMPPPLSSASPQAAPEPYQPFGKLNPRKRLPWLIAFGAMALIIGGQFYYILTQDEAIVNERKQRPPVSVVPLAHTDKAPIDVTNNGGVAQTPSAAYLQKLSPSISSGSLPLLIIENNSYRLGNLIGPADLGLRWTQINDNTKTLEFIDKTGQRYDLKF